LTFNSYGYILIRSDAYQGSIGEGFGDIIPLLLLLKRKKQKCF